MLSLASIKASNAVFTPPHTPVALFVGGTSGVGEGTATAFAHAAKGNAHIIICGRNKDAAERIIANFPKTDQSRYEFVPCDATLMSNVANTAQDIKKRTPYINYLVLSQGITTFKRDPTPEGLDKLMVLTFYSRWKFVDELMPCLETAASSGQEARVMSMFAPAKGLPLDMSDLGLKSSYTVSRSRSQTATYTNLLVEEYAQRHPKMSFTHVMPGYVATNINRDMPTIVQGLYSVIALALTSIRDCGEWMTHALLDPSLSNGAFYLNHKLQPVPAEKIFVPEKDRAVMVEHFQDATRTQDK